MNKFLVRRGEDESEEYATFEQAEVAAKTMAEDNVDEEIGVYQLAAMVKAVITVNVKDMA